MTDLNPYDFLSAEPAKNGAVAESSTPEKSELEAHAPEATIARADSVAALEARENFEREAFEKHGPNGSAHEETDLATVPELAPLAEPQSAPLTSSSVELDSTDSERTVLKQDWDATEPARDQEQDLFAHLAELRMRILRSIVYVLVASVVTWNFTAKIQEFLLKPVLEILEKRKIGNPTSQPPNIDITVTDPMQGFMTYFQLALVSAVIVAAPFIIWEMWRFIEPALTNKERRYSSLLLPFSISLFVLGCALGYFVSPLFFNFFLAFVPPGVAVMWTYSSVVVLLGKMLLVFGVTFQVPVVTIFLNKAGVVQRNVLIEYWRHVVVVIFVVVSILTPTWDPFTLLVCATPPCVLYALSIWLIKWL